MAFSTRYVGEYQTEIWRDLKGDVTLWTSVEITRCIERAVDDLSRSYPLEAVYEHTIIQTVTGEHWTASSVAGGFVGLGYKPIEPGSETVTDSSGNACTRDTDYTIDYINGRIAHVAGGEINSGEADCHITYKKDRLGIDISAIITNLIRVVRVEYPGDKVPQQFASYNIWNDFMYIGSRRVGESQERLADKEHVVIYYEKPHTAPLAAATPSYPAFLDEVICKGAAAYALLMKALQYEHQAVTDLVSSRAAVTAVTGSGIHGLIATALGNAGAKAALAGTALGKVAIYLETNTISGDGDANAQLILENITGDAAQLRTRIDAILSKSNVYLFSIDTPPSAHDYLIDGDDKIDAVNIGSRVAEVYADYARASMELFQGLVAEATVRIANLRTYIEEAGGWNRIADTFIAEAAQRVNEAGVYVAEAQVDLARLNGYLAEASQGAETVNGDLVLADRFKAEGLARLAEFHAILANKAEYRKRTSTTPVKQPA